MLFNSFPFLCLFLPAVLIVYYCAARFGPRYAAFGLVLASFVFYGFWNPSAVILLVTSIAFNFCSGVLIHRYKKRLSLQRTVLGLAVAGNILLLAYYKYWLVLAGWLGAQLNLSVVSPGDSVLLPLGISFFTFTQIGYLVDLRDGLARRDGLLDYVLFVTFFPHLLAGPILYHRDIMPQFAAKETYRFNPENLAVGFGIFVIGLAKKVIIADTFSSHVGAGFANPARLDTYGAWTVALAYSLQIYFDFSGYSDMAIGLARMFGVRFPPNFDSPFKSKSIIEFWQRWHITLSRYLNLYVYSPLSTCIIRHRVARGKPISRQGMATPSAFLMTVALPIFCTMILAGVWHGAGLPFLVYGLLHGFYLTANHAWRVFVPKLNLPAPLHLVASEMKLVLTFLAVVASLVIFRARSVSDALEVFKGMLGLHVVVQGQVSALELSPLAIGILVSIGLIIARVLPNSIELFSSFSPAYPAVRGSAIQWVPNKGWGIVLGMMASASILLLSGAAEFLYFFF
jgi:D-alanyl-lipoteichoic acid acyltransferase DltB (MBOAT superfamily)